jgi:hypothetical protein
MKALDWVRFLESQLERHGKTLFRVAELANVAGRDAHTLNVELARLVKRNVLVRYVTGVYGLPGQATPEHLVSMLDDGAYITGAYALYRQNLIAQTPTKIVCFTNRRHNRSRERQTPFGRLVFVRIAPAIHHRRSDVALAEPLQALCDYVHLALRAGLDPATLVTFRGLPGLPRRGLPAMLKRYPPKVGERVRQMLSSRRQGGTP